MINLIKLTIRLWRSLPVFLDLRNIINLILGFFFLNNVTSAVVRCKDGFKCEVV